MKIAVLSGRHVRSGAYGSLMSTHKNVSGEPSALVSSLLARITELRKRREMPLGKMMKAAGSTQQAWSRWGHGSAPRIDLIEAVVRALDAELVLEVRDRRSQTRTAQTLPAGLSQEAVEIANALDVLPEDARAKVRDAVFRLIPVVAVPTEAQSGKKHSK
jgi:transcriptional regulator with XRE-family HTH domain